MIVAVIQPAGQRGRLGWGDSLVYFEVRQSAFINDASEDVQRLTRALMVPQPFQYFTTPVAPLDPAALGVPVSYALSSDDISLPPDESYLSCCAGDSWRVASGAR